MPLELLALMLKPRRSWDESSRLIQCWSSFVEHVSGVVFLLQLFEWTRGWSQLKHKELFSDIPTFVNYPPYMVIVEGICVFQHGTLSAKAASQFHSLARNILNLKHGASSTSTYLHGFTSMTITEHPLKCTHDMKNAPLKLQTYHDTQLQHLQHHKI